MNYSNRRNFRDTKIEKVESVIKKINKKNIKPIGWFRLILNKIKLYMSYLKLK
jgi:hypothetical protein